MDKITSSEQGIRLLVEKCRLRFQLPENKEHYTKEDYKEAERRYVKLCLNGAAEP